MKRVEKLIQFEKEKKFPNEQVEMDLTMENIETVFKEHPKFEVIKNLFNISKHE